MNIKDCINILSQRIQKEVDNQHNDCTIDNIAIDSRHVQAGDLFAALPGVQTDGLLYVNDAIAKGARSILAEHPAPEGVDTNSICWLQVDNVHEALAELADAFYEYSSSHLVVIGVTGTNGKTTTATLGYELLRSLGYSVGLISTVCIKINDQEIPATHTTPDTLTLNRLFADMVQAGCTHVFMEVSSHALVQSRVHAVDFDMAIFSNLTRDHLDYHGSFADYLQAKKSLFDGLKPEAIAITNSDDKNGEVMLQNCSAQKYTYAIKQMADYKGKVLELYINGTLMSINGQELHTQLCGAFNAYNVLALYAMANQLLPQVDDMELMRSISQLKHVNGRFDVLTSPRGYHVVVDYAHTPDALLNVLETIQALDQVRQIITVVGAGGNRDKGKRPEMASISAKLSDQLILTSDNPRFEKPEEIINDMKANLTSDEMSRTLTVTLRREAINVACRMAQMNDIILIAGKGHETYQEVEGVRHHFDDKEEVQKIFTQEINR